MRHFRRARKSDAHGASAVEFALVLPILVLFVFGIIEFGFAYNRLQGLQAAVREGGRVAAVGLEPLDVRERVWETAPPLVNDPEADLTVTIEPSETAYCTGGAQDTVTVTVQVTDPTQYAIRIPLLPNIDQTFESTAVFRCERTR